LVPGEGIEPTLLSKLDFEKSAPTFSLQIQTVTSAKRNFTRSLEMIPHRCLAQAGLSVPWFVVQALLLLRVSMASKIATFDARLFGAFDAHNRYSR
jgi:hypothetical protein